MIRMDDDCAFCRSMGLYSRGHTKNKCFRLYELNACDFCGAEGIANHTASHCPSRPRVLLRLKRAPYYSAWIRQHPQWIIQSQLMSLMGNASTVVHPNFTTKSAAKLPLISIPPPKIAVSPPRQNVQLGCLMCGRKTSIDCCYTSTSDTGSVGSAGTWFIEAPKLARPDMSQMMPTLSPPSQSFPIDYGCDIDKNNNNGYAAVGEKNQDGSGRLRSTNLQSSKGSSTVESYLVRFRGDNYRRPPSHVSSDRSKL